MVDWRKGRTGSLVSPGMAECQGPALWAYNNAVFTDKDFENINKLAGETKVEDISKIGRFGLGFNAVYHLTDVPSFISRQYLVIFDPNIHHLQRCIRDRSLPGIHFNLAEKPESLTRYHDQFQPYNSVFGCNTIQTRGRFHYDGTLFRFPFRTSSQARSSDISKTVYDRNKVKDIVSSVCECASTLLIFSQHVKEVEVYELDNSSQPDEMRLVLSVQKSSAEAFQRKGVNAVEPFIKQCSKWWLTYRDSKISYTEYPSGCELVNIVTVKEPSDLNGCERRYSSNLVWFVVSASGTNASLEIAHSPKGRARGYLPCGGVAFVIQRASEQGSWESGVTSDLSGELFCFFPLSISTGLPVHVNGYFAIMPNRVEIWKRTMMRTQSIEVKWNEALMEDALARAYIMLLENMKELIDSIPDYKFHSLWPCNDVVDMKSWEKLIKKICTTLLNQQSELFYSDGIWMSINDGFLLNDDFDEIHQTAAEILRSLGVHVFILPGNILETLMKFDEQRILQRRTLSFTEFLENYFMPQVETLTPSQRDSIVCFGLDRILRKKTTGSLTIVKEKSLFEQNACISVSEGGKILAKPSKLIHPFGPAAELFDDEDHRFPVGNCLRGVNRLHTLERLGMVNDLDWKGILERAQSIANGGFLAKTERSRKFVKYLNQRTDKLAKSDKDRSFLQSVKFLPVLARPLGDYPLPWKGSSGLLFPRFCAPNDVFLPKDAKLIGSSYFIVNTSEETGCGKLNAKVKDLLGFLNCRPTDQLVIKQLDEAIKYWGKLSDDEKQHPRKRLSIASICEKIYDFFNDKIVEQGRNQSFKKELGKRDWLFLQGKFVQSRKVAYTLNGRGAPFLFTLPSTYKRDYRHLFEAMQIKQIFDDEDYIGALYELESAKKERTLTYDELKMTIFFITQIDIQNPDVENYIGQIPLPDTSGVLRRSQDLVVNLSIWLKDPDDNLKVHEKIPLQTARDLGAKPLKNVILKKYSRRIGYGESFGQHEELTVRLSGILDGYPIEGILKELLQNADDARASEIHFIHDTRSLRCKKVAIEDETCNEIQGPALCVYNDRPFTEEDLQGIRKLGTGSKRGTIEKTGRYGIGFNSVYHLTDCPSFLSNDDTLVILDPHCRYVLDEDPGTLVKLTASNRNHISDTLSGYLAEHFDLQGSTMFRFPLRRKGNVSKISNVLPNMEKLMHSFQEEARRSLLFLNHVKKITISKIGANNKLEEIYKVETVLTPEDEKKREDMARRVSELSGTSTAEIEWEGASYTMRIKEKKKEVEKWLIQKCIGSITTRETLGEIPDGRTLGLLPRGGLAARLWTHSKSRAFRGLVYCFLPLPENYTDLPVHVNGHFALDSSRRGLWTDTDGMGLKCKWNHFMKTCVLPRAYATLIMEARSHLYNEESDNRFLHYHGLFPSVSNSPWKTLTVELYRYLGQTRAKVLPLLVPTKSKNEESLRNLLDKPMTHDFWEPETTEPLPVQVTCTRWLSADQAYFRRSDEKDDFLHLLIRIGILVLLHAPYRIHSGFKSAGVSAHQVSPASAIHFLRDFESETSTCNIGQLPKRLETTAVNSVPELSALIEYCYEDDDFSNNLEGMPLLLTQDSYLRVFDSRRPVFLSKFGELFPTQLHSFVHSEVIHLIPWKTTKSKENVVCDFTVKDLARLLPNVFTDRVLWALKNDSTWKFPAKGDLSKQWFKKFWNFLQNHTKPEPSEDFVSLECLWKWPVIPTTCGKLVTIKDAKCVLDMTPTGTESTAQENVRTFLTNLECPVLNKNITFNSKYVSSTRGTVTDPYVAHPHNVRDVLVVLYYMMNANNLDISKVYEDEIRDFLRFVQDNYERSEALEQCKKIVKKLPFHKTLSRQFVSLTDHYSSYALIPSSVPVQQLDELQEQAKSIFLSSDALPTLAKLYTDLGVKAGQNVAQFYMDYVLKHFNLFTRESQLNHLIYIRDNVYASFPIGTAIQKKMFLQFMTQTPCIPDQYGHLHMAVNFFDPNNDVFKVMYKKDGSKFPPPPFNETDWSDLLQDIGLQISITPELFLKFCFMVAAIGKFSPGDQQCRLQSQALVKCLFSEESLQEETILAAISQIMFVAPDKVEGELSSIHKQYQSTGNGSLPFIKFSNAVPWHLRLSTWTTAPLLPKWLQLDNMFVSKSLGVACSGPPYTKVIEHLQNVASSVSPACPDSVDSKLIYEITKSIYRFLLETIECCDRSPNDECSDDCVDIGIKLKNIPCIFLQEDKTFVKANQLVFKLNENFPFKPFLYPVPRELVEFEHLLKRLGATEKPTPSQIAFVLNSIHQEVGEEALLDSIKLKTVKYAMHVLFELLYKGESADGIDELYLPSQDKQLLKSSRMVCKVSPRFTEVIERCQYPILLRFEECNLRKVVDSYIDALPEHLRPSKFDEIVREEVDPKCKVSRCAKARHGLFQASCSFQEKFQNLLQSDEFQEGLERLLMEDSQNPQEFRQVIKKLQTDVVIKCVGLKKITVFVINRETNVVLDHLTDSCYAVRNDETWYLYMQHDHIDDKPLTSTAKCVNGILGNCVRKEIGLIAMLNCSSSNEIASELNKLNIVQKASNAEDDDLTDLDDEISLWDSGDKRGERDGVKGSGRTGITGSGMGGCTSSPSGGYGVGFPGGGGRGGGYSG